MDSLENAINAFDGCLERLNTGEEEYTREFLLNKFKEMHHLYSQTAPSTKAKFRVAYEELTGEFYLVLKDHFGYKKENIPSEIRAVLGIVFYCSE